MDIKIRKIIEAIPFWKSKISIKVIKGGITNQNFLITEDSKKYVVRLGDDIPEHLVSRSNELAASKAAASIGISPLVIYHEKGILILEYIESTTLSNKDVKKKLKDIIPLIKKIHNEVPKKLYGQSLIFWVFHVIRNYANFLHKKESRHKKILFDLLNKSKIIEQKSSPFEIVFGHNDLLAGNFLDDGSKLWVIDWEYAGYNTPLFDLGGLSSNNNFGLKRRNFSYRKLLRKKN